MLLDPKQITVSLNRRWTAFIVLAIMLTVGLHLSTLLRYPAIFVDEIWQMSRAWGFLQTEKTFGMLDSGVADQYPGYWTFLPWLGNVIQALALGLSGAPSLFALRLLSLMFGGLLLVAVFSITRTLSNTHAAWISVGITAYAESFWFSTHFARYDSMVAALGLSILALILSDEANPRWWVRILCGLMASILIEIHAFGAIYIIPIAVFYLWKYKWTILKQSDAWQVFFGGVIGIAFYVWKHVLPYPDTFFALNKLYFGPSHTIPLVTLNPVVWGEEIIKTIRLVVDDFKICSPLIVFMIIWSIRNRQQRKIKLWMVISISLFLAFALLFHNKFIYYTIHMVSIFSIGLGIFIYSLWKNILVNLPRKISFAIKSGIVASFLFTLLIIIKLISYDSFSIYQEKQAKINAFVLKNDTVMGSHVYWYGLYNNSYYAWEQIIYYQRMHKNSTIEDALTALKPTIFILDGYILRFISDKPEESAFFESLRVSKSELKSFLDRKAVLLESFQIDPSEKIQIYRINWEQ